MGPHGRRAAQLCTFLLIGLAPTLGSAAPITIHVTAPGGGGDCFVGEPCRVLNPTFSQRVNGENPLAVDQMEWVESTAHDAAPPAPPGGSATDLTIIMDFAPDLTGVPSPGQGAAIFEWSMHFNDPAQTPITQLTSDADIVFHYPHRTGPPGVVGHLGYLDESSDPPEWRAEDDVLTCGAGSNDKQLCGKTNHLTLFAVVPVPEPSTALLVGLGLSALAARRPRLN